MKEKIIGDPMLPPNPTNLYRTEAQKLIKSDKNYVVEQTWLLWKGVRLRVWAPEEGEKSFTEGHVILRKPFRICYYSRENEFKEFLPIGPYTEELP